MKYKLKIKINKELNEDILKKVRSISSVTDVNFSNDLLEVESINKIEEKEIEDIINDLSIIKTDVFYFDGIDCPNCANKVEVALNKSSLIEEAKVIFLNNKIIVKHGTDNVFNEVKYIVESIEKDAKVYLNKQDDKKKISMIKIGRAS